jgi:predicted esterase
MRIAWSALGALLVFAGSVQAQAFRYELGRRLREFEKAWAEHPGDPSRRKTCDPLQQAVGAFFTARFGSAAKSIDEARFALEATPPSEAKRWASSIAVYPSRRLLEARDSEWIIEAKPFYETARPEGSDKLVLRLVRSTDRKPIAESEAKFVGSSATATWKLQAMPPGDHRLEYQIVRNDQVLAGGSIGVSLVRDLDARLTALKDAAPPAKREIATEAATRKTTVALLRSLAQGGVEETDYPAERLLTEAEALTEALSKGTRVFTRERGGESWLTLIAKPSAEGTGAAVPLRVMIPPIRKEGPSPPLVVALHGAGGSRNMFFDAYGDGAIVKLCRDRGWMLAAPTVSFLLPLPDMLDELHARYDFDRSKVFVIGHSMGAAQAMSAASANPRLYAGIAAIGGSGSVKASDDLLRLPFFIGVGEKDFALRGAKALKERLEKAGVRTVAYRELRDVEHLGIVQQSLPDVFRWFDELAAAKR